MLLCGLVQPHVSVHLVLHHQYHVSVVVLRMLQCGLVQPHVSVHLVLRHQYHVSVVVLSMLLCGLVQPHVSVRQAALSCIIVAKAHGDKQSVLAMPLIKKIVKRQEEIMADPMHVPYVSLILKEYLPFLYTNI